MKWLIVILAGCLLVPLAAACNDDGGGMSLEAYFAELDRIDDEFQQRSDEIGEEFPDVAPDAQIDDTFRDALRKSFGDQVEAFDDFIDEFKGLDPPEEAESLHGEAEDALDELRDAINEASENVDQLQSEGDFETLFSSIEGPNARVNEICMELEQFASDKNIEVDFNCEDE